jgi:hypothetical protein
LARSSAQWWASGSRDVRALAARSLARWSRSSPRRAFGPLGLALAGGYAAKKIYDGRKKRRPIDRY